LRFLDQRRRWPKVFNQFKQSIVSYCCRSNHYRTNPLFVGSMEEKNKATTPENAKSKDLKPETSEALNEFNTTNTGVKINNDQDSLKAGDRGPSLLEDFIMREKLTHFDHERIPERVVHARGTGAHGVFQVYESLAHLTKAEFLHDPTALTPVFVRFSTVVGSRGSSD